MKDREKGHFPTSSVGPPFQATLELCFLPNEHVSRAQLFPLGRRQPSGNQGEDVETNSLEDDVRIPRVADVYQRVGQRRGQWTARKHKNIRREGWVAKSRCDRGWVL